MRQLSSAIRAIPITPIRLKLLSLGLIWLVEIGLGGRLRLWVRVRVNLLLVLVLVLVLLLLLRLLLVLVLQWLHVLWGEVTCIMGRRCAVLHGPRTILVMVSHVAGAANKGLMGSQYLAS